MENLIIDDRYVIKTEIGHGGYASVFLAFDNITKRFVAIKIIKCDINADPNAYKMFEQEAMTMAAITNPNVVKIYASGIHENNPYLVMEYVKGNSLRDMITNNGYLLVDEVYTYTMKIINGLEACHASNIIHRDLKPTNIIKKSDGDIVLIDFGTAFINDIDKNIYKEDQERKIGTVQYMAPEIFKDNEITAQTDIYALGVTIFEMFTGKFPFIASDPNDKLAVVKMHLHTPFPSVRKINPNVPEAFEKIIYKCCEKDPRRRYKNVNELRLDLIDAYDLYKNPNAKKKGIFSKLFKRKSK